MRFCAEDDVVDRVRRARSAGATASERDADRSRRGQHRRGGPSGRRGGRHRRARALLQRPARRPAGRSRRRWPSAITIASRARDIDRIAAAAREAGAAMIVTTEKDDVRLLPFEPWPLPIGVRADFAASGAVRSSSGDWIGRGAAVDPRERAWLSAVLLRHRIEYGAVTGGRRSWPGCCRCRSCSAPARCSAPRSIAFDGAHRRLAISNLAGGVSAALAPTSAPRSRAACSRTSGGC